MPGTTLDFTPALRQPGKLPRHEHVVLELTVSCQVSRNEEEAHREPLHMLYGGGEELTAFPQKLLLVVIFTEARVEKVRVAERQNAPRGKLPRARQATGARRRVGSVPEVDPRAGLSRTTTTQEMRMRMGHRARGELIIREHKTAIWLVSRRAFA